MSAAPTAASLREKIHHGALLGDYTDGQVANFDRIIQAHPVRFGRNMIQLTLPSAPAMAGLERSDAQRVLYAQLIAIYSRRGFDVRLAMNSTHDTLYLFFDVAIEASVDASMSRLIKARLVNDTEFKDLLRAKAPLACAPGDLRWDTQPKRPAESGLGPLGSASSVSSRPQRAPEPGTEPGAGSSSSAV